jgi:hypothetical protein
MSNEELSKIIQNTYNGTITTAEIFKLIVAIKWLKKENAELKEDKNDSKHLECAIKPIIDVEIR